MSIIISNLTVQDSAPSGTVIGVLTAQDTGTVIPCTYTLTKGSAGLFAVAGDQLVTAWSTPPVPGFYSVRVHAVGTNTSFSGSAIFTISVTTSTAEWTLTQASVSGTTVADASGNGNAATVVNGPLTFGTMGANFNGQQCVESTLKVTSSALTVAVWFNAANLSNANPRLVANSHTDADASGFQIMFNSGGASGFFDVGNGTAEGRASWSQQLVEGTWYHYVGVYNGTTVSAYLNGLQVASAAFAGGAIAAGTGPDINIARNPTYAGDYFIGATYDVRIYEQALSAAQVLALYQAVTPPSPSTPTAITLSPASATTPDNVPAGTLLTTATVTMSDGSQFTGTLTSSDTTGFFAISGLNIVTGRALTSADVGTHSTTITASQNGASVSMEVSI
jgi:large repetitive protein